jgi:hypothetical protein
MTTDDENARKARARRLRAQIGAITGNDETQESDTASPKPAGSESPREFIERRMRETAQSEGKKPKN